MPCIWRGSIKACGKADANRLCWYQMWARSWASPCRDGGQGSGQSHQLFPSISLVQFRGLEGLARQTGRCQLGGQVDGAAQAEGSAATHGWMATKPRLPLTQTPLAGCILQLPVAHQAGVLLLWTLFPWLSSQGPRSLRP